MFLQENWFHDCDNEHAKITAFFQVLNENEGNIDKGRDDNGYD